MQCFFDAVGKLWINEKCRSIFQYGFYDSRYFSVQLNAGKNRFIIELDSPKETDIFSIQLRNYDLECSDDFHALSHTTEFLKLDQPYIISDPVEDIGQHAFRTMCFLPNEQNFHNQLCMQILDSKFGLLQSSMVALNETTLIKLDELRMHDADILRHVTIQYLCKSTNGKKTLTKKDFYPYEFHDSITMISEQLMRGIEDYSPFIQTQIRGWESLRKKAEHEGNIGKDYFASSKLYEIYIQPKEEPYQEPGNHMFFIHSKLDDQPVVIRAIIPECYDQSKKLPTLLFAAPNPFDRMFWQLGQNGIAEPCLIFDITGHRVVGGSYVGEAGILEMVHWLNDHYAIDENRVYMLGESDGGYATWSIAQNHPHLVAAVYPMTGLPFLETPDNTMNIPIYQSYSSSDPTFIGWTEEVKQSFNKKRNYHQIDFEQMTHLSLRAYLSHRKIINDMLKNHRNLFPDDISFITIRNRHLRCYWISLHGIVRGEIVAKISAHIDSPEQIRIELKNSYGVTVDLPSKINRNSFVIVINGEELSFTNYNSSHVIIKKTENGWIVNDIPPSIDYIKGTGILDVYMDNVRIILGNNTSAQIKKVAHSFSEPLTNVNNPHIDICYPVYDNMDVLDTMVGHNIIIFDLYGNTNRSHSILDLPVQCSESGFTYHGETEIGKYIVLQAVANPHDCQHTILVVSSNDENLLARNIFTRRVILPFYVSGTHKYLNNQTLIYSNNRYKGIYELEGDIYQL